MPTKYQQIQQFFNTLSQSAQQLVNPFQQAMAYRLKNVMDTRQAQAKYDRDVALKVLEAQLKQGKWKVADVNGAPVWYNEQDPSQVSDPYNVLPKITQAGIQPAQANKDQLSPQEQAVINAANLYASGDVKGARQIEQQYGVRTPKSKVAMRRLTMALGKVLPELYDPSGLARYGLGLLNEFQKPVGTEFVPPKLQGALSIAKMFKTKPIWHTTTKRRFNEGAKNRKLTPKSSAMRRLTMALMPNVSGLNDLGGVPLVPFNAELLQTEYPTTKRRFNR